MILLEAKNLIRLLKAKGISVLITDRNAREIFSIVDRSYFIQHGKVFLEGTVDKTEQIKGIGDVHFYFNGEEDEIFHKIFGTKNL